MDPRNLPIRKIRMNINDCRQGDKIVATFNPKKTDTLKDSVKSIIGKTFMFSFLWYIDDEDSSVYAGQIAWGFPTKVTDDIHATWCPSEDLDSVHFVRDMLTLKSDGTTVNDEDPDALGQFTYSQPIELVDAREL